MCDTSDIGMLPYVLHAFVLSSILFKEVYIHGSVHRESNLTIFQLDATYSVY